MAAPMSCYTARRCYEVRYRLRRRRRPAHSSSNAEERIASNNALAAPKAASQANFPVCGLRQLACRYARGFCGRLCLPLRPHMTSHCGRTKAVIGNAVVLPRGASPCCSYRLRFHVVCSACENAHAVMHANVRLSIGCQSSMASKSWNPAVG